MVPDYALIGEIMFYAYGFTDAKVLAKKMVTTFTLSSEQFSSQTCMPRTSPMVFRRRDRRQVLFRVDVAAPVLLGDG